jgi:hypothetical protein
VGINAPPVTFEAGGRQYVTVMTGLSRVSKGRVTLTPELRDMRDQTMLFVFSRCAQTSPTNVTQNNQGGKSVSPDPEAKMAVPETGGAPVAAGRLRQQLR